MANTRNEKEEKCKLKTEQSRNRNNTKNKLISNQYCINNRKRLKKQEKISNSFSINEIIKDGKEHYTTERSSVCNSPRQNISLSNNPIIHEKSNSDLKTKEFKPQSSAFTESESNSSIENKKTFSQDPDVTVRESATTKSFFKKASSSQDISATADDLETIDCPQKSANFVNIPEISVIRTSSSLSSEIVSDINEQITSLTNQIQDYIFSTSISNHTQLKRDLKFINDSEFSSDQFIEQLVHQTNQIVDIPAIKKTYTLDTIQPRIQQLLRLRPVGSHTPLQNYSEKIKMNWSQQLIQQLIDGMKRTPQALGGASDSDY